VAPFVLVRSFVLCMSGNAFGSDWAQLEAGTVFLLRAAEQAALRARQRRW
jgi:hypothetical protein